jgi:HD-GYP domain-containing protein (c-di-GMP phosphodiesterase class II)/CheY-like chemotaxis protein
MAETSRSQLRKLKDEYARNPGSRVFVHLAEAYRKSGDLRQAQQVLTDGLRRHVDDPSGLVVLARVLTDQGEVERAAGVWRDVLRQDPENVVALRSLAELADSAGRRDEAMQLFRRVVRLENGEPDADETVFAPPAFDDDDAPPASAPAPAASAPAPQPAAAPPASKSRFSWLVRSVGRTLTGEPAAEPAAPPVGRDLLAAAAPEVQAPPPAAEPVQPDAEQEETVYDVAASRDDSVYQADRDDTVFQAHAEHDTTIFATDAARDDTVFLGDVAEEDTAFQVDAGQGDEAAFEEQPEAAALEPDVARPEETVIETEPVQDAAVSEPDVAPETESAFQPDAAASWSAAPEPDLTEAARPEEAHFQAEAPQPEDLPVEAEAAQPEELVEQEAAQPEAEPSLQTAERTPVLVEVVPGDIVVISVEEPAAQAEAGEQEQAEEEPAPDAEPAEEAYPDETEIETQEEIVAAGDFVDEEETAEVPEFAELAQLAYEGAAEPAPDPLAQVRAQMFGSHAPEHDETVGGAAALAEVLVRLLERDGSAIRAESSLRRLLAAALARELGLPEAQQESLALAALLGSLGELAEPAPGGASNGRQLSITLQLLSGVTLPAVAREALAHQCERWDGGGYPSGLREDQIPFPARILAVARAAAGLLGTRGAGAASVVDELQRQAGSAFDPLVVSVLRRVFAQRERHGIGYGWGGRVAVAHPRELRALELASRLHGEGYAAETAGTAAALRDRLRTGAPEALLLGADLPDADAAALVREVRGQSPTLPVLVVDAPDARRRVELLGAGADVCFPPDADFLEVRATLDALLRRGEN